MHVNSCCTQKLLLCVQRMSLVEVNSYWYRHHNRGELDGGEADKSAMNNNFQVNKLENWEEQVLVNNSPNSSTDVKQEDSASSYVYGHGTTGDNYHSSTMISTGWAPAVSASSPRSCVTSLSTGVLNFSSKKSCGRYRPPDQSSEVTWMWLASSIRVRKNMLQIFQYVVCEKNPFFFTLRDHFDQTLCVCLCACCVWSTLADLNLDSQVILCCFFFSSVTAMPLMGLQRKLNFSPPHLNLP